MGRFYEGEESDEPGAQGRWQGQLMSQIRGKKGQAFLRELLASLEAIPDKRLTEGAIAKDGCVCALGAVALKRRTDAGESRDAVLADLASINVDVDDIDHDGGDTVTGWAERELATPELLAIQIPWVNDDGGRRYIGYDAEQRKHNYAEITPEERWARMVRWTKRNLGMATDEETT